MTGNAPSGEAAQDFVRRAEEQFNSGDVAAIASGYAADASLELISDGARELRHGRDDIARGWTVVCAAARRRGFQAHKTLLCSGGDVLVNSWRDRSSSAQGVEIWRFGPHGDVVAHAVHGFGGVRPARTPRGVLQVLVGAPAMTVAVVAEQWREHRAHRQPETTGGRRVRPG